MLGAVGELRRQGSETGRVVSDLVGSARFLNPFYLGLVALALLGVVVVAVAAGHPSRNTRSTTNRRPTGVNAAIP